MNNADHRKNTTQPRTSDFIGFSNASQSPGSPSGHRFNPVNFSSPQAQGFNQQNNRRWTIMNQNKTYHGGYSYSPNRSFNSSYNYNNSNNRSFNNSSNQSFNNSTNRSFNNSFHFKAKQDHNQTFNKELFLHPSFMEDPWAQLEAKQKQFQSARETLTTQVQVELAPVVPANAD